MVYRIPISKARADFNRIVERAHQNKEYFILEEHGKPVAGILAADKLQDYLVWKDVQKLKDQMKEVRQAVGLRR